MNNSFYSSDAYWFEGETSLVVKSFSDIVYDREIINKIEWQKEWDGNAHGDDSVITIAEYSNF